MILTKKLKNETFLVEAEFGITNITVISTKQTPKKRVYVIGIESKDGKKPKKVYLPYKKSFTISAEGRILSGIKIVCPKGCKAEMIIVKSMNTVLFIQT